MGGVVGDARKRLAEASASAAAVGVDVSSSFRPPAMALDAFPGEPAGEQALTAPPVADETLAEWRAMLASGWCLCRSASTDWQTLDDLLAEIVRLRAALAELQASAVEALAGQSQEVSRLRAALDEARAHSAETYEDGYDQGHQDAHADGAAEDRVCRERKAKEAAESELAAVREWRRSTSASGIPRARRR